MGGYARYLEKTLPAHQWSFFIKLTRNDWGRLLRLIGLRFLQNYWPEEDLLYSLQRVGANRTPLVAFRKRAYRFTIFLRFVCSAWSEDLFKSRDIRGTSTDLFVQVLVGSGIHRNARALGGSVGFSGELPPTESTSEEGDSSTPWTAHRTPVLCVRYGYYGWPFRFQKKKGTTVFDDRESHTWLGKIVISVYVCSWDGGCRAYGIKRRKCSCNTWRRTTRAVPLSHGRAHTRAIVPLQSRPAMDSCSRVFVRILTVSV